MSYLAIARKWRPKSFEDLVGQDHVVQTLRNAIAQNRVAHAYLFSGPRGIGKTSVARIFARALRCPNNEMPESQMISEGKSLDVAEIDGASNNGVESVRSIRENVAYAASTGTYKIYIIDEVHMLSISAFNALLKTLEEPPAHVVFIFATTEAHKIPMTILSRCQRFDFRRLSTKQIVSRLQFILKAENFSISDEGLMVIASHSDGSLRDALSLLDQVLSHYSGISEGALTEDQVVQALGISDSATSLNFVKSVVNKDIPALLKLIEDTFFSGIDMKHFLEHALEEVRRLYHVLLASESRQVITADTLDIASGHFEELISLAPNTSLLEVERMSQILNKTIGQLNWASLPRFVVEMASVRMAQLDGLSRLEQALAHAQPISETAPTQTAPAPATRPALFPTPPPSDSQEDEPMPPDRAYPEGASQPSGPADNWKVVVEGIMKKRPLLGALLSHANFKLDESGATKKVILAFEEGSFYEKQVSETKNRDDITALLKQHFGENTDIELTNAVKDTNASLEKVRVAENSALRKKALEHPSVAQAREALGAEVVDVNIDNGP